MGKRKPSHSVSDQFGEYGGSQDRDEQFAPMGRGRNTGGGSAGASARKGANLSFERHVPKFLQPYAHMLGAKREDEDEPVVVGQDAAQRRGGKDSDDGDDAADDEAVSAAIRCTRIVSMHADGHERYL